MLTRRSNLKLRLAILHRRLNRKQEVLRGHALMVDEGIYLEHDMIPP